MRVHIGHVTSLGGRGVEVVVGSFVGFVVWGFRRGGLDEVGGCSGLDLGGGDGGCCGMS